MSGFRRLRQSCAIRDLVRETRLCPRQDLVQPFFVTEGETLAGEIPAMPGIFRFSLEGLLEEIERYYAVGGRAGIFFGIPTRRDPRASGAYAQDGIIPRTVRAVKKHFPDFLVITDVCLCAYTDHGHCGAVENTRVDNAKTLPLLARAAVCYAQAGSDIIAPSDMMDHRVGHIRQELDRQGLTDTLMLSYAVKYASAFYGPFREALDSAPGFGDRKGYQMDPANVREAEKEAVQDITEGADILMVKPALPCLDVISRLYRDCRVPIAAYQVSGEYAMIKAAARNGWIEESGVVWESLTAIKRAGAGFIISYFAGQVMASEAKK